jgi:hypothetical protein
MPVHAVVRWPAQFLRTAVKFETAPTPVAGRMIGAPRALTNPDSTSMTRGDCNRSRNRPCEVATLPTIRHSRRRAGQDILRAFRATTRPARPHRRRNL